MPGTIMNFIKDKTRFSLFLLIVIYLVGFVTALLGFTDSLMQLTPFNLLFAAGLIIYNTSEINARFFIWFACIAVIGFLLEWIGITTGIIFGEYHYGDTLGIQLMDVPLIIGINWSVLVFSTAAVVSGTDLNKWLKSALAATLMVCYDFLLEPVAVRFDFWTWTGGEIPVQNYLAWWIISFMFLLPTHYLFSNLKNRIALPVILVQALFFVVLILKEGLF